MLQTPQGSRFHRDARKKGWLSSKENHELLKKELLEERRGIKSRKAETEKGQGDRVEVSANIVVNCSSKVESHECMTTSVQATEEPSSGISMKTDRKRGSDALECSANSDVSPNSKMAKKTESTDEQQQRVMLTAQRVRTAMAMHLAASSREVVASASSSSDSIYEEFVLPPLPSFPEREDPPGLPDWLRSRGGSLEGTDQQRYMTSSNQSDATVEQQENRNSTLLVSDTADTEESAFDDRNQSDTTNVRESTPRDSLGSLITSKLTNSEAKNADGQVDRACSNSISDEENEGQSDHLNNNGEKSLATATEALNKSCSKYGKKKTVGIRCKACNVFFPDSVMLAVHMSLHRSDCRFGCNICGRYLHDAINYASHMGECAYGRPASKYVEREILPPMEVTKCPCSACGITFPNYPQLLLHYGIHFDVHGFVCKHCMKGQGSAVGLISHQPFCLMKKQNGETAVRH